MYGRLSQTLQKQGYIPVPLNGKRPTIKEWTSSEYTPPTGFDNNNVGVLCGVGEHPLCAIDIDFIDHSLIQEIKQYIVDNLGYAPIRIGRSPKLMFIYRASRKGIRKQKTKESSSYQGHLEILGVGQQFVAYGIHPDTKKPYTWGSKQLHELEASELRVVTEQQLKDLIDFVSSLINIEEPVKTLEPNEYDPDDPLDEKPRMGLSYKDIKDIISVLDPDCPRDMWRNIGMAIHYETEGSSEGLNVWDAWSARGSKYKEGEIEIQWESFGKNKNEPITFATVQKYAGDQMEKIEALSVEPDFFQALDWSIDRFEDNPPEIPMLIDNVLVEGITSVFYSAGGAGKSTILLHMAAKIGLANSYRDLDFFGNLIHPGQVVLLTAEDPDLILNRRFNSIVQACADDMDITFKEAKETLRSNMFIQSTFGKPVHLFSVSNKDGNLKTTPYYKSLTKKLETLKNLKLLIIDTKTRYSPAEGLGNVTATQEITYYESIAQKTGAHVMLLHHSNKASRNGSQTGVQAYRDASAIYDSVRAAWYLRGINDDEKEAENIKADDLKQYLILENSKNNYIRQHNTYVVCRDGFDYSAWYQTTSLSPSEKKVKKAEEEELVFLRWLQEQNTALTQADMIQLGPFGRAKTSAFLQNMMDRRYLEKRRDGKRQVYELTTAGSMDGTYIDEFEKLIGESA
jgi:RecA-family ATPase